jgi:hypothetical protein
MTQALYSHMNNKKLKIKKKKRSEPLAQAVPEEVLVRQSQLQSCHSFHMFVTLSVTIVVFKIQTQLQRLQLSCPTLPAKLCSLHDSPTPATLKQENSPPCSGFRVFN